MVQYYKTLFNNTSCNGGSIKWVKGKWTKPIKDLDMCSTGYHLTTNPFKWLENANQIWLAEYKGKIVNDDEDGSDKVVVEQARIVRELSSSEIKALRRKLYPFDLKAFEKKLGDIPTKKDVVSMLNRIDSIEWFKPQKELDKKDLSVKVNAILSAFHLNVSAEIEYHTLKKKQDWASAWASAWDSAWAYAQDSARDSARASAWDSAWAYAQDSARAYAWAYVQDSTWAYARDSTWAAEFEVVKDLMKKKGYDVNPFSLLLELWEMGLYPVGLLKDKKFHIYYVPKKESEKK